MAGSSWSLIPATEEAEMGGSWLQTSPGPAAKIKKLERPYVDKKQSMVVHNCNLSYTGGGIRESPSEASLDTSKTLSGK
jgi:hypothetical protein